MLASLLHACNHHHNKVILSLLFDNMPRSYSDAPSMNSSLYYRVYDETGCNESSFYGKEVIITSLVAMKENVFCVVNVSPGQSKATYGKNITTCNDAVKTALSKWYGCNTTDCSICIVDSEGYLKLHFEHVMCMITT